MFFDDAPNKLCGLCGTSREKIMKNEKSAYGKDRALHFFVNCTNNDTGNKSSSIKTVRIFVFIKYFVNFLSKHINKT